MKMARHKAAHLARRGLAAEDLVAELFRQLGYEVELQAIAAGVRVDLLVGRDGILSPVEVISSRLVNLQQLLQKGARLHSIAQSDPRYVSPIVAVLGSLTPQAKHWAAERFDTRVWDISVLLQKATPFRELYQKLNAFIGGDEKVGSKLLPDQGQRDATLRLIGRLNEHEEQGVLSPAEYEQLCQEAVTFLFDPDLYGFERQAKTSDGSNRYDFICRIRPGNPFWDTLRTDFRTRSILFECKNYGQPITADQVYSTERYLFSGALRTVCFLISRKGPDEGCKRAAQGALRESGKLVLLLSNRDLVEMLQLKTEEDGPTSYLDEKIWQFIITLPR
jgi:hypothetical protein